ncbi:MAG: chromate transporter [Fusobacteriaceae bacterium]|jgi:chromate transporter|nr:chromate transporter [Fusobacteriaceae bacterium]
MIFLELFWSFFQVGLFTVGGGYASLPLIQNQVVNYHGWLTLAEFTDLITISQMTPGPIAINSATFVGTRIAGLPGAIVATAGFVTPSCIIMGILAYIFFKYKNLSVVQGVLAGLRPAVVAMILSAGLSILILCLWGEKNARITLSGINNYAGGALFLLALFVLQKFKPKPMLVMAACGAIGAFIYL